ncbi:hypothetical protein GCM10017691_18640 [Pseudonocardia petroleophila]
MHSSRCSRRTRRDWTGPVAGPCWIGVLALLGACSVPPGGLVGDLLLPFRLIAAGIIIAVRRKGASAVGSV